MPRPVHTRRAVLAAGLGGLLVASGCGITAVRPPAPTSSGQPTPGGSPLGSPSPSAGQVVGAAEAASLEVSLAARTAGILARSGSGSPDARLRRILTEVRDAHLDHAGALAGPDPVAPGGAPAPAPRTAKTAGDLGKAIGALAAAENAVARAHRGRIDTAAGDAGLLWASLAAAAQGYAVALASSASRSATVAGRTRRPLPAVTGIQARQSLLAQTYAALYGYQAAVPFLDGSDQDDAFSRISGYYRLRDDLRTAILGAGGQPPAADPTYQLSPQPTGGGSANRLMAGIELRIQPYLGQWVRLSVGPERRAASGQLFSTVTLALDLGAPLDRWPGWPS